MDSHTLYDSFKIRGKWKFPEGNDVSGTILYHENRIKLTTEGIIPNKRSEENISNNSDYPETIPVIHGVLVTGEKITLINSILVGKHVYQAGMTIAKYHSVDMFVGEWYSSKDSIKFDTLCIDYSNLNQWCGLSGFVRGEDIKMTHWSASLKVIDDVMGKLNEDITVRIKTKPHYSSNTDERKVVLSETNEWVIESKKELSFDEFDKLANCFRHYLMLGMGKGAYFVSITGMLKKTNVKIFPTSIIAEKLTPMYYHDMFFRYYDIRENFDEHLKKWYDLWNKYNDVMLSYFSMIDQPNRYMLESEFLTLAVALESFHRIKYDGTTSSFHERMAALVNNQIAFNDIDKEKNAFIENVKNTRNYYAHGNDEDKIKAKTDANDLIVLVNKMQILMAMCLINELPFNTKTIENIAHRIIKKKNYVWNNNKK